MGGAVSEMAPSPGRLSRSRTAGRGAGKRRRRRKKKKKNWKLTERWWPTRIEGRWEEYLYHCEWISQEYNVPIEEVDDEKWWSTWNRTMDMKEAVEQSDREQAVEVLESVTTVKWQAWRASAEQQEKTRKQRRAAFVEAARILSTQLPDIENRRSSRREQSKNAGEMVRIDEMAEVMAGRRKEMIKVKYWRGDRRRLRELIEESIDAEKESGKTGGTKLDKELKSRTTREARKQRKRSWQEQTRSHGEMQLSQRMATAWEQRKRERMEMWEAPPPGPPWRWEARPKAEKQPEKKTYSLAKILPRGR